MYRCLCTYTYTYTYIHISIYTYTHTYTHNSLHLLLPIYQHLARLVNALEELSGPVGRSDLSSAYRGLAAASLWGTDKRFNIHQNGMCSTSLIPWVGRQPDSFWGADQRFNMHQNRMCSIFSFHWVYLQMSPSTSRPWFNVGVLIVRIGS